MINSASKTTYGDLINRLFEVIKDKGFKNSMLKTGFVEQTNIPMNTGWTRRRSEGGQSTMYASNKAEGANHKRAELIDGYYKDSIRKGDGVSISYEISLKMRENAIDNRAVREMINFISTATEFRKDLDLAMRLSFAASTSYTDKDGATVDITTGDGLALKSSVHTLTASTETYTSEVLGNPAFSETALELAENTLNQGTYSNLGENIKPMLDTIFSTTDSATCNAIKRLLRSTSYVESDFSSGVINTYNGRYRHVEIDRLNFNQYGTVDNTKNKYWGLLDSKMFRIYIDIYSPTYMIMPTETNNGANPENEAWLYRTGGAWDTSILSARGFIMSTGDGA